MKIYIAGTISKGGSLTRAEQEVNYQRFYDAEALLRADGHEPLNPLRLVPKLIPSWAECLRIDLRDGVLAADAIYMLRGWQESRGARLEFQVAAELGIPVMFEQEEVLAAPDRYAGELR